MQTERARVRLWTATALVAGLLLRLWFVLRLPHVAGDSLLYGDLAQNLLLHHAYGFSQAGSVPGSITIRPTLIRLPGYPLFLAACFRLFGVANYRAILFVQTVIDLATCWVASATAGRLFGRRAALATLWLAALCPFTANYCAAILTETTVLATIAVAFYALVRWQEAMIACKGAWNRWLGVVVAALSASLLLRPDQGLLAAAIVPAVLWIALAASAPRSLWRGLAPVCVAGLCVLLPLVPWTVRNRRTMHVFQPLAPRSAADPGEFSPVGFDRWYRTWGIDFASTDQVYWNMNSDRIEVTALPARAFALGCRAATPALPEAQPLYTATAALLADYNPGTTDTPALDARFAQLAKRRAAAAPLCVHLLMPAARLANMLLRPRTEMLPIADVWWRAPSRPGQIAFAAAYAALNLLYLVLGFAGLYRLVRVRSLAPDTRVMLCAMAVSILLRCALLLTLDNSEPRYTLEFFPILFVWAGSLWRDLTADSLRE